MSKLAKITKHATFSGTVRHLASSKSISNRVQILDALAGGGSTIHNLSTANDTLLLRELLRSESALLDVEDAGTTMRFLTAYFALHGSQKTITGTERMKQRPIGILVDALRSVGASIEYIEKEGFPPVKIGVFSKQTSNSIQIRGDVSSQYISAMMMIAPMLTNGLTLSFQGKLGSKPYIEMTAALMKKFGANVQLSDSAVSIPASEYKPCEITIESDWSSASYWFAFVALANGGELLLPQLTFRSIQGDAVIVNIMEQLGVKAEPRGNGLLLMKKEHHEEIEWDFTHCPDLAQTVSVVCAAKNIKAKLTGLESLRIKETDRIKALQNELGKIGAQLFEQGNSWILKPSSTLPSEATIETYLDHRMAMAFAPLAACMDISINNPMVVRKSYPEFWDDVRSLGFRIAELPVD